MSIKAVAKRALGAIGATALAASLLVASPPMAAAREDTAAATEPAEAPAKPYPATVSADALPTVTREILTNAIETRQVCVCLLKGVPNLKCRRCLGASEPRFPVNEKSC